MVSLLGCGASIFWLFSAEGCSCLGSCLLALEMRGGKRRGGRKFFLIAGARDSAQWRNPAAR
jgi:hypothetical protein